MSGKKSIFYNFTAAAIFVILEIAALSMLMYNGELQNRWVSKRIHSVMANVWGATESVRHYFSLKKTGEALADENFELRRKLAAYQAEVERETERTMSPEEVEGTFRYIPASIVKMSAGSQHNYMIINKGNADGVKVGDGIITRKGAVGIVDAVSRNYSYATAFTNSQMAVSARIGRLGAVGTLAWDGRRGATISEIPHHIAVEQGDTVFTSGFSAIFPPDIPLGLCGEKKIVNGAFYEIKVELFEDYSSLRYVTVVKNTDRDEIGKLESDENRQ